MTMELFEYKNLDLRYMRSGTGSPVVLLHNGGTSHAIWKDIFPLLDGFELFALDLLGFGASSKPGEGYELEHHTEILAAFIEYHDIAPVFLVGNCMGSAISLSYAIEYPHNIQAMVLINTLTAATFAPGIYGRIYGLPRRAPGLISALSKIPLGTRLGKFGVRSQLGRHGRERKIDNRPELRAAYASATQSESLLQILANIPNYDRLDQFEPPENFPPIATIWGLENRVLPADEARNLVRTLQPDRQEWLQGCGHLPMLEQPEQVAAIINEFFHKSSTPERTGP